jgi:hypothetical protein
MSLHQQVSRRAVLRGLLATAAGVGAVSLIGCGDDAAPAAATPASPPATPTRTAAVSPTAIPAAAGAWVPLPATPPSPGARRDHSMTYDGDGHRILLFGGRRAGIAMDDLWSFDVATSTWTEVASTRDRPAARFAHTATYDASRKRLIVATGQGDGERFFNDVWAFDGASGVWRELGAQTTTRPEIRYGAGGAHDLAGNRIFVSHGFTSHGRFDDTWTFDLASETWTQVATDGDVPIKRCLTRCLWLPAAKRLLLFGGQTDATPYLGDFWSLDAAAGTWTELTPALLPGPRNLYGAALHESSGRWYIVGGNTAAGPTDETWYYDIAAATWTPVAAAKPPPRRYSPDAAIAGAGLYVFGGNDGTQDLGDAYTLSLGL